MLLYPRSLPLLMLFHLCRVSFFFIWQTPAHSEKFSYVIPLNTSLWTSQLIKWTSSSFFGPSVHDFKTVFSTLCCLHLCSLLVWTYTFVPSEAMVIFVTLVSGTCFTIVSTKFMANWADPCCFETGYFYLDAALVCRYIVYYCFNILE